MTMKRVLFGAVIAFALASCGGEATEEEVEETPVDAAAVVELENATKHVENGMKNLENEVDKLNADVDSLLNGI